MDVKFRDRSCAEFTALLASSAPAPGGGGAAALMGALSVSLCSMSASLSRGKKKYAEYSNIIEESIKKSEAIRSRFLELIDEDAEAFLPLSAAYSIDKENPARDEIIERESLNACKAPMEMLRLSKEALFVLEDVYKIGNSLLLSDVGCGAVSCAAAMKCAAMNVYVNTKSLKDNPLARQFNSEIAECFKEYLPRAEALVNIVMNGLAD